MLLKWLVIGSVIYVLYKYFFGANSLGSGQKEDRSHIRHQPNDQHQANNSSHDDDYIDYEEVD